MATSGTWNSWILNAGASGTVMFNGNWTTSISRDGTSNKATITVTAKVKSLSGDYVDYRLYVNGSKVKTHSGYHAPNSTYTLKYSYEVSAKDAGGTVAGKVYVKTAAGSYSSNSSTGSYSLTYGAKTHYTVAYNANGGSGAPGSQTKYYGTNLTLSSTKPTRNGYTFKGWATSSGGAVAYNPGATYSANAGVTLYAVWQANATYTVTFDANGGTGEPAAQSGYSGTTITLSSTKPTKTSESKQVTITYEKVEDEAEISKTSDTITRTTTYTFKQWNTKADGKGTAYNAGATLTLTGNITLYAIWTSSTSGSATLPTGTLDQYALSGWSRSVDDINLVSSPYATDADVTLYAIWKPDGTGGMLRFFTADEHASEVFTAGIKVRLVGIKDRENDGIYTIESVSQKEINGQYRVALIFTEDFQLSGSQMGEELSLEIYGEGNYVPDMDYICAKDNRLWGCSSRMRTIYASALGDPTDFWTFAGDSLDAYQVAVGTPGNFTGCVAMNNNVLFFKQHVIHKMLGNFPAEYALYTYDTDGTSDSNGLSAVNCNGTIIYVSEHGLATYSGSSSGILSKDLSEGGMSDALAAFDGERYALHYTDASGEPRTYLYDTRYNVWIQKDYGDVLGLAHLNDQNYVLVVGEDTNRVLRVTTGLPLDGEWEIIFKPFYEVSSGNWGSTSHAFEKKRYWGLTLRTELPKDSWIKAEIRTDGERWRPVARASGRKDRVQDFVIRTGRCDKMQLKLSGYGPMTILAMERNYTEGSRR